MSRTAISTIVLLIAGTYTPFSVLALHGALRVLILAVVWTGAAVGIALKHLRLHWFRALTGAMYVSLGWVAVVAMPQFITGLPVAGPETARKVLDLNLPSNELIRQADARRSRQTPGSSV